LTPSVWVNAARFLTLIYVALILYFSLAPAQPVSLPHTSDKLQHGGAYLLLAILASISMNGTKRLLIWIICITLGAAIEWIQPLTGRHFELADMLANSIGTAAGLFIARILSRFLTARRVPVISPTLIDAGTKHRP